MHLNVCITVMEILLGIDTKWLFWLLGFCLPRQYGHFKSFWKRMQIMTFKAYVYSWPLFVFSPVLLQFSFV